MSGPGGFDPAAPLPALPVCTACGHLHIAHRRGRCRADPDGVGCGCTHFTTGRPAPAGSERLDLDDPKDSPPR